ncbi:hypothetical protein ACL9SP_01435 [Priestia flexa]|uniref:hypothetical protein n=1 Tax=Priestia flexa TaxID=86664 RepID=UPI0039B69B9E
MSVIYEQFADKELSDKIIFMEDWFSCQENIESCKEKDIKKFFRSLLENESNGYLKILSIETLSFLTLIDKVRKTSTIDMLLDIESSDNPFVITTALKYLTVFYDNDEEIYGKIESYRDCEQPDVSSEAYYRLGLINFFNSNNNSNQMDFLKSLEESNKLFNYSKSMIENRTDAEYFYQVTKYLYSMLANQGDISKSSIDVILNTSFLRQAFHYDQSLISLEYKVNQILMNLQNIYIHASDHEGWLNFLEEFKKLSQYHFELLNVSLSTNEIQNKLISNLKIKINDNILQNLYIKNFTYYEIKIDNIMNKYKEDNVLTEFLSYIKELINNTENIKKKDEDYMISVCIQLKEFLPNIDAMELIRKFKTSHDVRDVQSILDLIAEYNQNKYGMDLNIITGFETGEEIFTELFQDIESKIPSYPEKKLTVFKRIIEEIIKYLMLTIRSKRSEVFNFLYTEEHNGKGNKATERDLQNSLYRHFEYSRIAYGAVEEINNFADGGRIDIVFKFNNYTFPIELKKTNRKISKQSIQEKYLEQLHSYTYSYDQLGVFVLLDLNKKESPVNDVRELVYLDYLKPLYELNDKYPDYTVVVIIPGNKPLPSDKSTYR